MKLHDVGQVVASGGLNLAQRREHNVSEVATNGEAEAEKKRVDDGVYHANTACEHVLGSQFQRTAH